MRINGAVSHEIGFPQSHAITRRLRECSHLDEGAQANCDDRWRLAWLDGLGKAAASHFQTDFKPFLVGGVSAPLLGCDRVAGNLWSCQLDPPGCFSDRAV